jgi:hypothetical protein
MQPASRQPIKPPRFAKLHPLLQDLIFLLRIILFFFSYKYLKMFIPNLAEIQLAISLGPITHLCIFIHGELNSYATHIASSFIFAYLSTALFCYLHSACLLAGLTKASILISFYFLALGGSILAYRIFFHRIRHFPGDRIDALTKWGAAAKARRNGQYFLELKALHERHGSIVRIGLSHYLHISP